MEKYGINRMWLKIIAMVTMTIDHIGVIFFPSVEWFRIVGRLALPLFIYMIAEGAFYSKHRIRYLLSMFIIGVGAIPVYVIAMGEWYLCILMSFSFSLGLIYSYDLVFDSIKNKDTDKRIFKIIFGLLTFIVVLSISIVFSWPPEILTRYCRGFVIDYGIFAIVSPFIVYLGFKHNFKINGKWIRVALLTLCMLAMSIYQQQTRHTIRQYYSLISTLFIIVYNGKKGRYSFKYFFYVYYPLHLVAIYGIYELIIYLKNR